MEQKGFNVDLGKQFVPFWNGLIHLVGKVEQGTILRRTDWENIIQECKTFETDFLNTVGFCESCTFHNMPAFLKQKMDDARKKGITDCKTIAQDNDYVYLYCMEQQQTKSPKFKSNKLGIWIFVGCLILLLIGLYAWRQKKNSLGQNKV